MSWGPLHGAPRIGWIVTIAAATACTGQAGAPGMPDGSAAPIDGAANPETAPGNADTSAAPDTGQPDIEIGDGAADGASDGAPPTGELSAGCGTGAGLPDGPATISSGGMTRRYVVRLPTAYGSARPWPLVLALHPNGGNTSYWDGTSGDRALRSVLSDKAILVIPEARAGDWRGDLPADLAYFDAVIELVKGKLCVDLKRMFSMGFSGGGSFSGVLGCRRKDIRAIAAGGAVIYFDPKDCVGSPAAWITIGQLELIAGREAFRDFWRTRAGCDATSMPVAPSPCVAYSGCSADTPVHYCQHPGDHVWPSFGTAAAWAFFSQF